MILNLHSPYSAETLKNVYSLLHEGKMIAYPTDTIYGLGVLASNHEAVEQLFELKNRDRTKPMSLLCSSLDMLERYCSPLSKDQRIILQKALPGPYTFLLKASEKVPYQLIGLPLETVGIRIPRHPFCLDLVQQLNEPITTTSVNRSGEPALNEPLEIEKYFGPLLGAVIASDPPQGLASTILDITGNEVLLVRQGAGSWPLLP